MSKWYLNKIICRLGVFLLFIFTMLITGCKNASLADAQQAEDEKEYAKAYQMYASVLIDRTKLFDAPKAETITSKEAFNDWIGEVVAAFTSYLISRPTQSESVIASQKLGELEAQLSFLENRIKLKEAGPLSEQQFIEIFHNMYFSEQKTMPPSAVESARQAFHENYSILNIKGDLASQADVLLYNPERDIGIPLTLEWDSYQAKVVLLAPGTWIAVCKILLEASDPKNKQYFEARNIRGRYAATYFVVPPTSQHQYYYFMHHNSGYDFW